MTKNDMFEWHHRFNVHEFEQISGDSERQGHLVCCSPWDCKESDMTGQLNNNSNMKTVWRRLQKLRIELPYDPAVFI